MLDRLKAVTRFRFVPVLALLLVSIGPAVHQDGEKTSTHFYFVQVTDTHFGVNDNERQAQKVVDSINSLPMNIEFVAHTGDMTQERLENEAVLSECLGVMKKLKHPVHYVPGNHDILRRKHESTAEIFTKHFGGLITRRECHGVLCLFVYTEPLARDFEVKGCKPLEELEQRLKEAGGKPVLVFHHTPSVEDFYKNKMHRGWKQEIRDRWVGLLNQYGVKAVFAGHFHRDEHHWLGNVPLYISSSVGDTMKRGRQATYRIYEYRDGRVGYRTQYLK